MDRPLPLSSDVIETSNTQLSAALEDDYDGLGRQLQRRGVDIEAITRRAGAFSVALPSWGAGRGGTRFAKFPLAGGPTNIHEKLEDCAAVQQLCRITPRVSPHFPGIASATIRACARKRILSGLASMPSTRTRSRTSPDRR